MTIFSNETYHFKETTNRSHPIPLKREFVCSRGKKQKKKTMAEKGTMHHQENEVVLEKTICKFWGVFWYLQS